ncbi:GNAT family N-acetyltransferase [Maribacter sp. 2210JD10-5]|uniref:GNAT family N-acetyltransferase n=1 Tax=Maribacter sp. 2210JD10-5 TaxID=3386272 RepID=UPI0039BC7356
MTTEFDSHIIEPVHEKHAWRLCDFVTINADRFKKYFPETLKANLTPDLAGYFTSKKVKAFQKKEEFLFILKEKTDRTIIGLIYLKELDWEKGQGELAYAVSYTFEGKGYISKSVSAICDWAFKQGLKTLQIIVNKENTKSIKVAENCGFLWKATLPKKFTPPNSIALDMELYERSYER